MSASLHSWDDSSMTLHRCRCRDHGICDRYGLQDDLVLLELKQLEVSQCGGHADAAAELHAIGVIDAGGHDSSKALEP